jgi:hypothetical protein
VWQSSQFEMIGAANCKELDCVFEPGPAAGPCLVSNGESSRPTMCLHKSSHGPFAIGSVTDTTCSFVPFQPRLARSAKTRRRQYAEPATCQGQSCIALLVNSAIGINGCFAVAVQELVSRLAIPLRALSRRSQSSVTFLKDSESTGAGLARFGFAG